MDGGVYGEDDKKFIFNNVIIGRKAKARFKISNTNKVPCDILFSVKPVQSKGSRQQMDIFEVEPVRAQIMNHSHVYATVTFTPSSMQVRSVSHCPWQRETGTRCTEEMSRFLASCPHLY